MKKRQCWNKKTREYANTQTGLFKFTDLVDCKFGHIGSYRKKYLGKVKIEIVFKKIIIQLQIKVFMIDMPTLFMIGFTPKVY